MKTLALTTTLALLAFPAVAQDRQQDRQCGPRDDVLRVLSDQYGETRQSVAITVGGSMFEMLANLSTGSWTALMTTAGGPSCLVASGGDFEVLVEALEPPGIDG